MTRKRPTTEELGQIRWLITDAARLMELRDLASTRANIEYRLDEARNLLTWPEAITPDHYAGKKDFPP